MSDSDISPVSTFREQLRQTRSRRLSAVRRLLVANLTNKEIAIELDVSELRVRKDVKAIMDELGVTNRRQAGRRLADAEGVHREPGSSRPLTNAHPTQLFAGLAEKAGQSGQLRDVRVDHSARSRSPDIGLPFRQEGSVRVELKWWQRLIWIVLIACVAFTTFGLMSLGVQTIR